MTFRFSLEVIIAAYNDAEVLALTLEGYRRQSSREFALCVADDGSGAEVLDVIERYRAQGLSIRHVWHEDQGFRKAQIVNRAIAGSQADYIVFSDSDCVPMRHFIADHRDWACPGYMVSGRRVDTAEALTARIKLGELALASLERPLRLVVESMRGNLSRAEFGLHLPRWLARLWSRKPLALLGANMGVWREQLLAVNGFDSDFEGYGAEEVDLEWRLRTYGIKSRAMRGRGGLIHIHHYERQVDSHVYHLLQYKRQVGEVVARNGIHRLSA
ncbi:N-terminal domain of galactosyltransferase [Vreelandella subterranea]|uniref:N-terminal domain of galactosyltransferase n=1 Tax=Vreelandella subterranea TaxID=416874 RepID=A0A1H9RQE9_9GAMM|nr:glycosyltransferase [Halomonas subterranea]SER74926.1 N-terminal domain of galactosyltransferase [Halomonas subterranea]